MYLPIIAHFIRHRLQQHSFAPRSPSYFHVHILYSRCIRSTALCNNDLHTQSKSLRFGVNWSCALGICFTFGSPIYAAFSLSDHFQSTFGSLSTFCPLVDLESTFVSFCFDVLWPWNIRYFWHLFLIIQDALLSASHFFFFLSSALSLWFYGFFHRNSTHWLLRSFLTLTFIFFFISSTEQALSLANNRISYIAPNAFSNLRSLQQLILSGNRLSSIAANCFSALRSLRRLDLTGNDLNYLPSMLFHGLNQLQVLGLAANQLTFRNASLATALSPAHLPALRILDLSRNPLQLLHASFSPFSTQRPEVPVIVPSSIPHHPAQRLFRNHQQLTYRLQPQAAPLQSERPWAHLRELRLHASGLQHVDGESLDTLTHLETLHLAFNEISVIKLVYNLVYLKFIIVLNSFILFDFFF